MKKQNNTNIKAGQTFRMGSGTGHDPVRNLVVIHADVMHKGRYSALVRNMITGRRTLVLMDQLRHHAVCLNPGEQDVDANRA